MKFDVLKRDTTWVEKFCSNMEIKDSCLRAFWMRFYGKLRLLI